MFKEFRDFILKGNMLDLAVAVIIAGAFGKVVSAFTDIPAEQTQLPSAALGWRGGGEISVDPSDRDGLKATEPFYEVRARVVEGSGAALIHGRSGKLRFTMAKEPLAKQEWRRLRQLLQKRYRI